MDLALEKIFRRVAEVGPGLHTVGTLPARALEAIARNARLQRIRHSVETGSGASTLLLSHLSGHHTVFALDDSGSITNVRRSPLLRPDVVTLVEGPTQATLPRHRFTEKLQLALINGPHGYPFPDLEYYYRYPHLDTGALLIIDDIQIRTVHKLFEFLRRDAMFRLIEVVQTTAFFARTEAPTFDRFGDGWWQQAYNGKPLLRYVWKDRVKRLLPQQMRRSLPRLRSGGAVDISAPRSGASVAEAGIVEGSAVVPDGAYLWILVHRKDVDGWWPQGGGAVPIDRTRWSVQADYGVSEEAGHEFEIAALIVGPPTHDLWMDWVTRVKETGLYPPVRLPPAEFVLGASYRTVRRGL